MLNFYLFLLVVAWLKLVTANSLLKLLTADPHSELGGFKGKCSELGDNVKYEPRRPCQAWDMNVIPSMDSTTAVSWTAAMNVFFKTVSANCNSTSKLTIYKTSADVDYRDCYRCTFTDLCALDALQMESRDIIQISSPGLDFPAIVDPMNAVFKCVGEGDLGDIGGVIFFATAIDASYLNSTFSTLIKKQMDFLTIFRKYGYIMRMLFFGSSDLDLIKSVFKDFADDPYVEIAVVSSSLDADVEKIANTMRTCPAAPEEKRSKIGLALGVSIPLFFLLAVAVVILCLLRRKLGVMRHNVVTNIGFKSSYMEKHMTKPRMSLNSYIDMKNDKFQMRDEWEIGDWELRLYTDTELGKGAFAFVYKGNLCEAAVARLSCHRTLSGSRIDSGTEVAVKVLKPHTDAEARTDFMNEIEFMKSLGQHVHILGMLAYVGNLDSPKIVLEYCPHDSLLTYLHRFKAIKTADILAVTDIEHKQLYSFAWQIGDGMNYLSSMNIVHRDLAARNILLAADLTVKISDFGLCRRLDEVFYTARGGKLPIKWMAIESLKRYEFTTLTDVWAYGVVLFEIFSLGDNPYPTLQPTEVLPYLEAGNRMPKPKECPEEIYDVMLACWSTNPANRPTFDKIQDEFSKLLNEGDEQYGYLSFESEC